MPRSKRDAVRASERYPPMYTTGERPLYNRDHTQRDSIKIHMRRALDGTTLHDWSPQSSSNAEFDTNARRLAQDSGKTRSCRVPRCLTPEHYQSRVELIEPIAVWIRRWWVVGDKLI